GPARSGRDEATVRAIQDRRVERLHGDLVWLAARPVARGRREGRLPDARSLAPARRQEHLPAQGSSLPGHGSAVVAPARHRARGAGVSRPELHRVPLGVPVAAPVDRRGTRTLRAARARRLGDRPLRDPAAQSEADEHLRRARIHVRHDGDRRADALRPRPRHADPGARRRSRALGHRFDLVGLAALADRSLPTVHDAGAAAGAHRLSRPHARRQDADPGTERRTPLRNRPRRASQPGAAGLRVEAEGRVPGRGSAAEPDPVRMGARRLKEVTMRFRNSLVAGVLLTLLGAAPTPAIAQAPSGFPRVIDALKAAPGCLGVETGQTASGRRVIFAWFTGKQALVDWYHSDVHQRAMRTVFPDQTFDRTPLPDLPD